MSTVEDSAKSYGVMFVVMPLLHTVALAWQTSEEQGSRLTGQGAMQAQAAEECGCC